jgi:hypothetical protein
MRVEKLPGRRRRNASGETSDAIEAHSGEPMEAEPVRRSHRQIDDAPAHERAAIRDRHNGRPSVALVGHADAGSARKGFVSGRKPMIAQRRPAGRPVAVLILVSGGIVGSRAAFARVGRRGDQN